MIDNFFADVFIIKNCWRTYYTTILLKENMYFFFTKKLLQSLNKSVAFQKIPLIPTEFWGGKRLSKEYQKDLSSCKYLFHSIQKFKIPLPSHPVLFKMKIWPERSTVNHLSDNDVAFLCLEVTLQVTDSSNWEKETKRYYQEGTFTLGRPRLYWIARM